MKRGYNVGKIYVLDPEPNTSEKWIPIMVDVDLTMTAVTDKYTVELGALESWLEANGGKSE